MTKNAEAMHCPNDDRSAEWRDRRACAATLGVNAEGIYSPQQRGPGTGPLEITGAMPYRE